MALLMEQAARRTPPRLPVPHIENRRSDEVEKEQDRKRQPTQDDRKREYREIAFEKVPHQYETEGNQRATVWRKKWHWEHEEANETEAGKEAAVNLFHDRA